jgi:single-strand DNA-binding protein
MNKALLIGNVTRDPEIKTVNDTSVVSFSLATNKKYTTKTGERKELVEFHNLTAWGKLAEIIGQYVKKGHKLYVSGELRTRTYEKEGVKHYRTDITVVEMEMLTPKGSGGSGAKRPDGTPAEGLPEASAYATDTTGEPPEIRVEDIPF